MTFSAFGLTDHLWFVKLLGKSKLAKDMTMTRTACHTLAMRGITVAAAAVALTMTATGTASAWHVPWGHHRHQAAAAVVEPIGRCKADAEIMGGNTCFIATMAYRDGSGVQVILQNYNDYPVKISTLYQGWDGTQTTSPRTTVDTRVPAHSERDIDLPWGGNDALYIQWIDRFNNHNLGSQIVDKP